jgi:hypothetical protein
MPGGMPEGMPGGIKSGEFWSKIERDLLILKISWTWNFWVYYVDSGTEARGIGIRFIHLDEDPDSRLSRGSRKSNVELIMRKNRGPEINTDICNGLCGISDHVRTNIARDLGYIYKPPRGQLYTGPW